MIKKIVDQKKRRFAAIGTLNAAIDFGVLFALTASGLQPIVSNFISTTLAFCFSFTANRSYTFKATNQHIGRQMALFVVVTLFGLWCIQPVIIWLLTPPLDSATSNPWLALFIAKCVATGVTMVWNYVLYSRIVFTGRADKD